MGEREQVPSVGWVEGCWVERQQGREVGSEGAQGVGDKLCRHETRTTATDTVRKRGRAASQSEGVRYGCDAAASDARS